VGVALRWWGGAEFACEVGGPSPVGCLIWFPPQKEPILVPGSSLNLKRRTPLRAGWSYAHATERVMGLLVARWKAIDWLCRRPRATCRVERRRVFSIILLIIIIVVVLALLGFFARGRF
jgi:hypothetical protein